MQVNFFKRHFMVAPISFCTSADMLKTLKSYYCLTKITLSVVLLTLNLLPVLIQASLFTITALDNMGRMKHIPLKHKSFIGLLWKHFTTEVAHPSVHCKQTQDVVNYDFPTPPGITFKLHKCRETTLLGILELLTASSSTPVWAMITVNDVLRIIPDRQHFQTIINMRINP